MQQPRGHGSRRRPAARGRRLGATPWLIGGGVALGGLALFLGLRGSGSDALPAPPPPPPVKEKPPDPNDVRRAEAQNWFRTAFLNELEREKELTGKQIDELLEEGKKRGYDKIPGFDWTGERKRVYGRLLRRDPDYPEANRAFGRVPLTDIPDFYDLFRKLTDAKALTPEMKKLRDQYEDKVRFTPRRSAPALEPAEFQRVAALLEEFRALDARYASDPSFKAIAEALERVKIDPILGQYEFVHVEVKPFVLFYGSRELKAGSAGVAEQLKARLESFRRLIDDLLAFHREQWIKPFGIKEFEPGKVFFVWVFGDKASWEDYGRQAHAVMPPGTKGYFSHRDHWAFVYDDPKERMDVEVAVAHELTHLLHWHYSEDPESEFKNHFERIGAVWFCEGWAEYVGWVKRQGDGYVFAQDSSARMESYRMFKKLGLPLYPLQELVKRESYADWIKEILYSWLPKKMKMPEEPEQIAALGLAYFELLYAESWLFMKFLYDGEGGKYRPKITKFTKASLKGYLEYRGERGYARAHEVFGEIFELKTKGDWDKLQAEFDRFLEEKLYSVPPPK